MIAKAEMEHLKPLEAFEIWNTVLAHVTAVYTITQILPIKQWITTANKSFNILTTYRNAKGITSYQL